MPEKSHKKNLADARKQDSSQKKAKDFAKAVSNPISGTKMALSLAKQFRINDLLFVLPLLLAMLKDISDLFLIGSLWGVGTIISICCSIMGGLFIWLLGAGEAKKKAKVLSGMLGRILVLIGGTTIEAFVMGVNFFPVQTATFVIIYLMLLYERAQEAQQEYPANGAQQYA